MLVEAKNLSFSYGKSVLFENINLQISSSSRIVIYGANGSGKSTFLSILAGIASPNSGEIIKQDNLQISYLFQNSFDQFVAPTVIEDVAFSLLASGVNPKIAQQRAMDMLEKFEISHLADRSIYYLSGGEKRLVAIAGALIKDADLYLFDEPFNELDDVKSALTLANLNAKNKPFVVITHSKKEILSKEAQCFLFTANGLLKQEQ
ncbi:energy-coupling factor ABC transporter ATP-binding protein [Campylobacter sp. CCUG 57310]|uniref:energy-coupling factor ABC transporter ATP-binding protein n=1 Tax=Campylobacter sp. CCUG 57310 TaxID=2517362 RepID=UPI0015664007|nr:ABC transporter ATP-binding protein [Campylobacter sp. CCUG 57310]QKF92760.1 cobalt/nickel ECF transporter CbiMNQO, A component, ATP-binding protein CbiO [Campylobacter sp. CCUG 57310]